MSPMGYAPEQHTRARGDEHEDWGEPPPFWSVGLLLRKCRTDKDRTAGNRTTVRLSNGYSLLRHVNAIATV